MLASGVLTLLILRGDLIQLQQLESEFNINTFTRTSDKKSGGREKGSKPLGNGQDSGNSTSPKDVLRSQFSEVFSGKAVNTTKLNRFSDRLFNRERRRIERELRDEMTKETWKIKQANGKIKKLKEQRVFEEEELEYYKSRRYKDTKRLADIFASELFTCMDADACKEALKYQLSRDSNLTQVDFPEPYVEPCVQTDENATELHECNPRSVPISQYHACSVVGNSGVMKNSKNGIDIDKSKAVFRINQAPTGGHVADVGTKTTFRVLNNAWAQIYGGIFHNHRHYDFNKLPLESNSTLILTRSQPQTYKALVENLREHGRNDVKVYQISPTIMQRAREVMLNYRMMSDRVAEMENRWKQNQVKGGTTPSTGFVAILLAKRLCDDLSVYGLSKEASRDKSSSSWSYHYFQQTHRNIDLPVAELRAHPHHSFRLEGIILNNLIKVGAVAAERQQPQSPAASDWTALMDSEKPNAHAGGCPVVRTPKSDCGGGEDKAKKEDQKKTPIPSAVVDDKTVQSSTPHARNTPSKSRSRRKSPNAQSQKRPSPASGAISTNSSEASNSTEPSSNEVNRKERPERKSRVSVQTTEVIVGSNHRRSHRSRSKARAEESASTEEEKGLQEILRAQQEQNEKASKIKKPHNSKHTPLDKIEVRMMAQNNNNNKNLFQQKLLTASISNPTGSRRA